MIIINLILSLVSTVVIYGLTPIFGLFLLSFSTPIIGWSFDFAGLNIPLSDLVGFLSVFAWLIIILYQLIFKPRERIKLNFPLIFPFACFLITAFLSLLNHPDPGTGLYYIFRWLILLYTAFIFLPYNLIKKEKDLKLVIWGLAVSSFLVMFSGWLSLLGQDWHNSFFRLKSIALSGTYPFGENHNLIAEFLSIGAFVWLSLKEWAKSPRSKRIYNSLFVLMLLAVIMTFSRAAWITIILQLGIYLLWKQRRYLEKQGGLIILAVFTLILLMTPIFWRMKILQDSNTSSTENRILLTEIAYKNWQDKPILGQGVGQFTNLVSDNLRFTAKYGDPLDSHGFLQKIMAEMGIIGLISWIFLLVVLFKEAIIGIKRYGDRSPWLLPLWIAAGGSIFFQLFNTSYYKGKVWLIVSLALIATELARKKYGEN
ncbi:O-antigen ligase family protein [Patescibacteria group bacterium]|nr:O-antigen ligase family protein [Patescibacteria group bacterium]